MIKTHTHRTQHRSTDSRIGRKRLTVGSRAQDKNAAVQHDTANVALVKLRSTAEAVTRGGRADVRASAGAGAACSTQLRVMLLKAYTQAGGRAGRGGGAVEGWGWWSAYLSH